MTKIELIRVIGDLLTRIDEVRGSLMPNDPQRRGLDQLRAMLDERQVELAQAQFEEGTEDFQNAAAYLQEVNNAIQETIEDIEDLESTLSSVARFVGVVDNLLGLALPEAPPDTAA